MSSVRVFNDLKSWQNSDIAGAGHKTALSSAQSGLIRKTMKESNIETYQALKKNERVQRILETARVMIESGGDDAFSMKDLAEKSETPRATLYRYYASKEHIYTDLTLDWSADFFQRLMEEPPAGDTIGEKITGIVASIFAEAKAHPNLLAVTIASFLSKDDTATQMQIDIEQILPTLLGLVMDVKPLAKRETELKILNRLLFSCMLLIVNDRSSVDESIDLMVSAAKSMLGRKLWQMDATSAL